MVKYNFFVCNTDAQVDSFNVGLDNILINIKLIKKYLRHFLGSFKKVKTI